MLFKAKVHLLCEQNIEEIKHARQYHRQVNKPSFHGLCPSREAINRSKAIIRGNRVPKCDVIKNEICEIMGFVKLF